MENDETVSPEDEIKDEETVEEVEAEEPEEETVPTELKKAQDEAAKWRRLAEKKAEPPAEVGKETKETLSAEDVDIKILVSQGMDEETVEFLTKLAKVNNTSILAAQQDSIYIAFKEKHDADLQSKKAALGASKGSGPSKKGKNFHSEGLTDKEHKELWKKAQGE